jgi:hypothetical protein
MPEPAELASAKSGTEQKPLKALWIADWIGAALPVAASGGIGPQYPGRDAID